MKNYFLSFLFFVPFAIFSQKNIEVQSTIDILQNAVNLTESEKYDESIEAYSKISLNDTNYSIAQIEIARNYFQLEDYKKAQNVLTELLNMKLLYEYNNDVYKLLGVAYMEDGQTDKAIEIYTEGIKNFPKSYSLYFNRSLAYTKAEKFAESIKDLKMAITCKASHPASHYQLGLYALNQGQYTEATLCLITFLMLESGTERANNAISLLENMATGEIEEKRKNFDWNEIEDYSQLNEFFKNKIALEKSYKVKLTVDCAYARQLHFLLSNLKYEKENKGFWNQTYLPFLLDIFNNKKYDAMILASLISSDAPRIQAKVKSKNSKITAFYTYARTAWNSNASKKFTEFEGEYQQVYIEYGESGITGMGKFNASNFPFGTWYYYHPNGSLSMIANFNDKGEKIGKWETYNEYNGKLLSTMKFEDNKMNGEVTRHYLHGEIKEKKYFKNDILEDTLYIYYRSGDLFEKYAIKNGLKNGDIIGYHENGTISYKYSFKDAVPNGPYKSYHTNGKLAVEFTLKENVYDDMYITYYPNGQMHTKIKYVNGLKEGKYESWYSTGQIEEIYNYKEGKQVGDFKEYYSNGALSYSGALDESGKQNGTATNFDLDGIKHLEQVYKKGELIEVHCYNKKGVEIYKSNKKGKKLEYKIYYPDGGLKTDGNFENDLRSGKWKFYDKHSNLDAIENYKEGQLIDTAYYYFPNGQIKSMETYQNGELNGLFLEYNIFGNLIREGIYKDGEWDKDWYLYNDENELTNEFYYVDGEQHGIQKSYDINGKLEVYKEYEYGRVISQNFLDTNGKIIDHFTTEFHGNVLLHDASNTYIKYDANYKNGSNDGITTWYGPDKNIEVVGKFVNGVREGVWKYFHENGKIFKEINYINGLIEGEIKTYNEFGVLIETSKYINDKLEGLDITYHDNGKKEVETTYLNDQKHGKATYYDEEGNIYMFRYYDQGIFKSYSYLGKDGKEITPIELKPGNNLIVTYFQNGVKACEHNRKNGLIEGHYILYTIKGQIFSDEEFLNGEFHGKSIYNSNGVKQKECSYKYGLIDGLQTIYHENGKIKSTLSFLSGEKHGIKKEYNKEGKLIKTSTYYSDELINTQTIK